MYFSDLAKHEAVEEIIKEYGSYDPDNFYEKFLNKNA